MKNILKIIKTNYIKYLFIVGLVLLTIGAGVYGYDYAQVKGLMAEGKQLSQAGKYKDAISKLSIAESKWSPETVKIEIAAEISKNKELAESSDNFEQGKIQYDGENYTKAIRYFEKVIKDDDNFKTAQSYKEISEEKILKGNNDNNKKLTYKSSEQSVKNNSSNNQTINSEVVEAQEVFDYINKVSPYSQEYDKWHQRLLNIYKNVENGTIIGSTVEANTISDGFAFISNNLERLTPPPKATSMHNHFIHAASNASVAAKAASDVIINWQYNQTKAEIALALMGEYLKQASYEKQEMNKEWIRLLDEIETVTNKYPQ